MKKVYALQDTTGNFFYDDSFKKIWGRCVQNAKFYNTKKVAMESRNIMAAYRDVKVVTVVIKTTIEVAK